MGEIYFTPTFHVLEHEGLLAQACLCNGLTALRHANLGDGQKGLFYSAFFELSIGFERMMKLIVILDYMGRHDLRPPPKKDIEGLGHKLINLFAVAKKIGLSLGIDALDQHGPLSVSYRTMVFLNDFAHTDGRYSNINHLIGKPSSSCADPLRAWGELAQGILRDCATAQERARVEAMGKLMDRKVGSMVFTLISDLNQVTPDLRNLVSRVAALDVASKYATIALVELIVSLRTVVEAVAYRADEVGQKVHGDLANIPAMGEFFEFAWAEPSVVRRKRRWP
ncbi:hypothetical protein [Geothrix mesophila]|uniref:hypothetical protein n=1 Tax=Geothrix mesophila TaxID=2922723 RepID=UPI001FAB7249|nr:hypothetical protein [Geothrix sp. SG198]